ncbi:MAG: helix-turn-helix transcriptional regulator [Clostridia bacterium]|nr:helix-turn-helix transcriptional regulator [Clostridia bacterium]
MLGTRYEVYPHIKGSLPFSFNQSIKKNPLNFTTSANWHENLEIQFCLYGEGIVLLDGTEYNITVGDIIVANSNVIHHMNTKSNVEYACIIIDTDFCKQCDIDPTLIFFEAHFKSKKIFDLFLEFKEVYNDTQNPCRCAKLLSLLLEILIELRQNHTKTFNSKDAKSPYFEKIKDAINIIRQNFNEKLTLEKIAKQVFINKFTLSKEFKKLTQMTVTEYINSYRCRKAVDYIKEGLTVSEAAHKCGFNNMSFFTKTFKNLMGQLPSKYKSRSALSHHSQ